MGVCFTIFGNVFEIFGVQFGYFDGMFVPIWILFYLMGECQLGMGRIGMIINFLIGLSCQVGIWH